MKWLPARSIAKLAYRLRDTVIGGLFLVAVLRVLFAFEPDAVTIATLSGLLWWTLAAAQRRNNVIGRKLDHLLNCNATDL